MPPSDTTNKRNDHATRVARATQSIESRIDCTSASALGARRILYRINHPFLGRRHFLACLRHIHLCLPRTRGVLIEVAAPRRPFNARLALHYLTHSGKPTRRPRGALFLSFLYVSIGRGALYVYISIQVYNLCDHSESCGVSCCSPRMYIWYICDVSRRPVHSWRAMRRESNSVSAHKDPLFPLSTYTRHRLNGSSELRAV